MRTRKELLRTTNAFAQEVRWKSWWHFWSTITVLGVLLLIICSETHWLTRIPFSVAFGLVLVRFFVLYHDYQHGALLRKSLVAKLIMNVFGLSTLNPPSVWKRSHDHHHAKNSKVLIPNVGSFPVMTLDAYRSATLGQRVQYLIRRHFLTVAFGYITVFFIGMCVGPLVASPRRHLDASLALVCHSGILVWFGCDETDDLWLAALLPFATASGVGALIFYMQHNFPGAKFRTGRDWDYVFAALHSSSYIRMNRLWHWLTGNIGYHHVHHLNHRIPFYRLPEAMAAIDELQSPTTISLSPADVLACFRLTFLDTDRGELVSRPARLRS